MKSIRIFLIVTLIATITLVNALSSLRGYSESMSQANKIFDDRLLGYGNIFNVIPWASMKESQRILAQDSINETLSIQDNTNLAYKIWDGESLDINCACFGNFTIDNDIEPGYHAINFNGYRWRALLLTNFQTDIKILVAERYDQRFLLSEKLVLESIYPIIIILPAIAILIWIIVGVGLAPVTKLAAIFRQKQVTDLSPIELHDVPKELTLLASSANDLLLRLEQSFEREKRFAADAAHEFRTPITALKLHIQNLIAESTGESEAQSKNIKLLKLSIDRMGHLIEQILTLNSTSSDLYMANYVSLDLVKTCQQIVSEQFNNLDKKQISIELKSEPCVFVADQFGIETLIHNLVSNAIKYTQPKGNIEIRLTNNGSNVSLMVMDSGPGIVLEQRDRVFERFYRVDGDRHNSSVTGCGLGLSIVKRIADLHNADISLTDSDFDTGLKITVFFPTHLSSGLI